MNLLTIQTLKDGAVARSFLHYDTVELAMSALYYTMSSSLADANVTKVMCELIGDNGTVCKMETYDKELSEV